MTSRAPRLLLFAALTCAPVLLAAGEAERCHSSFLPAVLSPCAHADLDGDTRSDLALTFRRSLTITLSTTEERQTLDLAAFPMASGVITQDIDGDRDKDLIVTAGFQTPVAVFVNDGNGRFSAGSLPSTLTFDQPLPTVSPGPDVPIILTTAVQPPPLLPPPAVQSTLWPTATVLPRPTARPTAPRSIRPPPIRAP